MSTRPIINAVVEAGLVPDEALDELAKWGVHIQAKRRADVNTPTEVAQHLLSALESEDQVRVDETDLDLLQYYLSAQNQKQGRLTIKVDKSHTTTAVSFCITATGEYAIPWTDEDEPDVLVNGQTHLKWLEANGTPHDVHFSSFRQVFFGPRKAFVVCAVDKEK